MIDYEKLLEALKTIQDECAKYKVCTDCPFFFRVTITIAAFSPEVLTTGS